MTSPERDGRTCVLVIFVVLFSFGGVSAKKRRSVLRREIRRRRLSVNVARRIGLV